MRFDRVIKWVLSLGILLLAVLVLGVVLYLTDSFFSVWDRLVRAPRWLFYTYVALIVAFLLGTVWLVWQLIGPRRGPRLSKRQSKPTEQGISERLTNAEDAGVDIDAAQAEISRLAARRGHTAAYVAFFGEISSGKSSLIKTLLADDDVDILISVRGGSTRRVEEYRSDAFPDWIFADIPGTNETEATLDQIATDEARRAHIVVYVCDGDLTRSDFEYLEILLKQQKPVVVALNKTDLMTASERSMVIDKIRDRLHPFKRIDKQKSILQVVSVSADSFETVVRILPNGKEQEEERVVPANTHALTQVLEGLVSSDRQQLDSLRDSAVFALASAKLDVAEDEFRRKESKKIVSSYTKKAVVGALAAVAPGTDLLIQGVLATALVKEMCNLYNAPIKDLDVQQFLTESQKHVGKAVPVVLAVSGNALKAFPGVGTVAGGFTHAVAYGLIFDALGKSLAKTLEQGYSFDSKQVSQQFQESLSNDLEARTKDIVKLVFAARKSVGKTDSTDSNSE